MNALKVSISIFLLFLVIQAGKFTADFWGISKFSSPTIPRFRPTAVIHDTTIVPPRRVVTNESPHATTSQPGERGAPFPPAVAWVFGLRMNWLKVTEENLHWIPKLHHGMAKRLIRIRDLYDIHSFRQLADFPKIGGKTIQRLKRYCYIPHAN